MKWEVYKGQFPDGSQRGFGKEVGEVVDGVECLEQDFKGPATSDRKPVELPENRSDVIDG